MEKINQKNLYILNFYISKCKIRNVWVEQHNQSPGFTLRFAFCQSKATDPLRADDQAMF